MAWKAIEELDRRRAPDPRVAVLAHDKELGDHVTIEWCVEPAVLIDQRKTRRPLINADQEGMAIRLHPVALETGVAEAPLVIDIIARDLASIVEVELHQVRQGWLIVDGREQRDLHGGLA